MKTLGNPWMGQNRSRSGGARAHTGANGRRSRAPPPGQRSGPPAPQVWAFMPPWLDSSGLLTRLPTLGSQQRLRGSLKAEQPRLRRAAFPPRSAGGTSSRRVHADSILARIPCPVAPPSSGSPVWCLLQTPSGGLGRLQPREAESSA